MERRGSRVLVGLLAAACGGSDETLDPPPLEEGGDGTAYTTITTTVSDDSSTSSGGSSADSTTGGVDPACEGYLTCLDNGTMQDCVEALGDAGWTPAACCAAFLTQCVAHNDDEACTNHMRCQAAGTTGTSDTDGTDTSATTNDTSGDESTSTGGGILNCEMLSCAGHQHCEMDNMGAGACICDEGYVTDPNDASACVVDRGCIQVRFLEDRCRQVFNGPPAVSLFFAADFCAGTAVLPSDIDELGLEFVVTENGIDIAKNVESYSTIIDKDVESYVTLAVDVSDSITQSEDLPALIDQLRTFVASLTPAPGEPDVYVSVYAFARDVAEYVPFTRDLAAVDTALAAIEADPAPVVLLAGNGSGTDLYDAVEIGINRTQRIRDLRNAVTWGGVLSTGTVVVVTDGNDTSNGTLNNQLIQNTTNNVISVGISASIDDEVLEAIGRDGSFLAPTVDDWTTAFAEITQRVDEYPLRSYLLAYCSSATEGSPNVGITMDGIGVYEASIAACQFNADYFSTDPADVCNGDFFTSECTFQACGGLTACGGCADEECCDGVSCQAPETATDAGIACGGLDDLCAASDQVCDGLTCELPAAVGEPCGFGCEPGVGYCTGGDICAPVVAAGANCNVPEECPELNCTRENPENLLEDPICRPRALVYDYCGTDDAICEPGSYCSSSACRPKKLELDSCNNMEECRLAQCEAIPMAGNRCNGWPACFWSWDEKVPS